MKLIHIENKIDVKELADVLSMEHYNTAMELLTIIKSGYGNYEDFRNNPQVQMIAKLYGINLALVL